MNTNEILAAYDEQGIDVMAVASTLVAYETAERNYPLACAQTPLISATIDAGRMTGAAIAKALGVTAMTISRKAAAGRIVAAHPTIDPMAVVKWANVNTIKAAKDLAPLTTEEVEAVICPKTEARVKSEEEKDLDALKRVLARAVAAHESGDDDRIAALRAGLYLVGDALDGVTETEEEEVA